MAVASAICATRSGFQDAASAEAWLALPGALEARRALRGRSLVYYNGAFSPPTRAHGHITAALARVDGVEGLFLDPEPARPGKERWQDETMEARVRMCELMVGDLGLGDIAGVGTLRRDLGRELGASPELFRTLRGLLGGPGQGRLLWACGADVFEGMRHWPAKARACLQPGVTCDGLVIVGRGDWTEGRIWSAVDGLGEIPCEVQVLQMPPAFRTMSSNCARRGLAAQACSRLPRSGKRALGETMTPSVASFCSTRPDICEIYKEQVALLPPRGCLCYFCSRPLAQILASPMQILAPQGLSAKL